MGIASTARTHGSSHSHANHRIDSHAPIGVMADHMHDAGEAMLSYRYMYMEMDGQRAGTNDLRSEEVFHRGFAVSALEMDSHMHMFGAMWAPIDQITFTAMTSYVEKDMRLKTAPSSGHGGSALGGHGGHGGHGSSHGSGHGSSTFGHSSSGWGDVSAGALFRLLRTPSQNAHLGLHLSFPTGGELERDSNTGAVLPYGMQLGSGTYDLKPSLTWLGHQRSWSYGAQASATLPLEDENDAGYARGDRFELTSWVAKPITNECSLSGRISFLHEDSISGHYNVPHPHLAPPHFTENYGGERIDLGIGANFRLPRAAGPLAGTRLAVEALVPVYEDLNGIGLSRSWSMTLGLQVSW